jgi:hypothetical protein
MEKRKPYRIKMFVQKFEAQQDKDAGKVVSKVKRIPDRPFPQPQSAP